MRPLPSLALLALLVPCLARAATYTVTPNDSLKTAIERLRPGDTLYLRGGTYDQPIRSSEITIASGTSYENAVTIAGAPGETARLTAGIGLNQDAPVHHLIIRDLTLDGTPQAQATGYSQAFYGARDSHHIRFDNVTATREANGWTGEAFSGELDSLEIIRSRITGWEYGFYMRGTNLLIERSEIYRNEGYGVHIYNSGDTRVTDNIVRNNYVHDNGLTLAHNTMSAGILLSSGSGNVATGNIVAGQGHALAGIQLGTGRNTATGNTIYSPDAPCILEGPGSEGSTVRDNICHRSGSPGPWDPGTSTPPAAPPAAPPPKAPVPSLACPPGVVKAFPTAEGFGAQTVGGRGGRVMEVMTLDDAGPGSLRECVESTGPRTCVFRVGGTIELQSTLNIRAANSFLTIAGQTAPGGGIQLKNWYMQIAYGGHDVILRHLRIRQGAGNSPTDINNQCGGLILYGPNGGDNRVYNVIGDHLSIQWACDDTVGSSGLLQNATLQWSLIGEGLNGGDYPGANSKGWLSGDMAGTTASIHHNLFLDLESRNPIAAGTAPLDWRNNLIYNWYACTGNIEVGRSFEGNAQLNFAGNVYLPGPHSPSTECALGQLDSQYGRVYATDNRTPWCLQTGTCGTATLSQLGFRDADRNGNAALSDAAVRADSPFPAPAVTMTPASSLEALLARQAGATKPARDSLDTRLIQDMQNRGGADGRAGAPWPTLASGTPPADSDHDGMPDSWETSHNLNPRNGNDGAATAANGYTNLENYLNELAGDCQSPPPARPTLPAPRNVRLRALP